MRQTSNPLRSAISLVVLMVEGTRGIDYLFGIILAVVVANWVANFIHHDGEPLGFSWLTHRIHRIGCGNLCVRCYESFMCSTIA